MKGIVVFLLVLMTADLAQADNLGAADTDWECAPRAMAEPRHVTTAEWSIILQAECFEEGAEPDFRLVLYNPAKKIQRIYDKDEENMPLFNAPAILAVGEALFNNARPLLLVRDYTGGMHCCYVYYFFDLRDGRRAATYNSMHSPMVFVRDRMKSGQWIVFTREQAFQYWRAAFADSPFPFLALRWREGRFALAQDVMARPLDQFLRQWCGGLSPADQRAFEARFDPSSVKDLYDQAPGPGRSVGLDKPIPPQDCQLPALGRRLAISTGERPGPKVVGLMADLIFSGNGVHARGVFDAAWPGVQPDKEKVWDEFRGKFSDWRADLIALNGPGFASFFAPH